MYKNPSTQGDMMGIIFKNGDGEPRGKAQTNSGRINFQKRTLKKRKKKNKLKREERYKKKMEKIRLKMYTLLYNEDVLFLTSVFIRWL